MDFDGETDSLQLQRLCGGDIIAKPPIFSPDSEFLFLISDKVVRIYSTNTGELVRYLVGNEKSTKLIGIEVELKAPETLVGCTITGELLRWTWTTGQLKSADTRQLELNDDEEVCTFNLLDMYRKSDKACAFVTAKSQTKRVCWSVIDMDNGKKLDVPSNLQLKSQTPLVSVQTKYFKNLVVAQGYRLFFMNYKTWQFSMLNNAHKVPITVVRMHPTEALAATGDEIGKIFLWREFMDHRTVKTSLYHWHHTTVTSIAFSAIGSSFYSSGLESVLVQWSLARNNLRNFLPRMCSVIRQIAVSDDNTKISVSTADNGVQFVGNDYKLRNTLQDFTYIMDDKTGRPRFPVGLQLNTRTNSLALNGRVGHMQFYSMSTRSLLYNIDVVVQNKLSFESDAILYDTHVTKAAFNIDWMATGEEYNDQEHLPELRLKFWQYNEEQQGYTLNTNVELPHEGGFKALAFSNIYQVDNLLCASAGADNVIRIWSLDDSDSIYRKGKVWYCVARTSYKQLPIESLSFSEDGSLLAVGCGNTLCVYKPDTLTLRAALSSGPGLDGCVHKVQVRVPKKDGAGANGARQAECKRVEKLFVKLLESGDDTLIQELSQNKAPAKGKRSKTLQPPYKFDEKRKAQLYQKVLDTHELNLWQKLLVLQQLGIQCQVPAQWQSRMLDYLRRSVAPTMLHQKADQLHASVNRLNLRERFKAKYRLHCYTCRQSRHDSAVAKHLVPLLSMLNLSDNSQPAKLNGAAEGEKKEEPAAKKDAAKKVAAETPEEETTTTALGGCQQRTSQLRHVQFCAGDYAHLVVVCTESRVLIWNLLTLRVHAMLMLSVEHLAFDAQNNLLAAFTKSNELHVFQANVPLPIYQRVGLPRLHGAIWLPRRYTKGRSINVDWQSQSTLYFLTEQQEIMYLGAPNAEADVASMTIARALSGDSLRYSTFGAYASKQQTGKLPHREQQIGPLIVGKTSKEAVKSLVELSAHTMPPLSLLCYDFVKALVTPAGAASAGQLSNGHGNSHGAGDGDGHDDVQMNGHDAHSDKDGEEEEDETAETATAADAAATGKSAMRRQILSQNEALAARSKQEQAAETPEAALAAQLQRIAAETLNFGF